MKDLKIYFVLFFLVTSTFANEITIVDIDKPQNPDEQTLVFASNGLVYELDNEKSSLVDEVEWAKDYKVSLDVNSIELENGRKKITGINSFSQNKSFEKNFDKEDEFPQGSLQATYITDMENEEDLLATFNSMRRGMRGRSQCYNRAMVWGWELFHKNYYNDPIQIGKAWVFFTKRYIRNYNYKWWFHIAPYLTVAKEARILDRTFTNEPKKVQDWTNQFVKTNQECPVVEKYSDYSQNQESSDCYLMKTSMHYWQPFDLENLERNNTEQTEYIFSELKQAYRNGVGFFAKVPYWN